MRTPRLLGKLVVVTLGLVLAVCLTSVGARAGENPACPPIAGIIEGPDPIPSRCLDDFIDASEDSDAAQSPDGDQVVAWADPVGEGHDIALREWTGEDWEATRFLTSTSADEREPNLFLDHDGTLYVAWTRYGDTPQVVFTRRDPVSGSWSADVVVAENARRPAIVARAGRAVLAFERLQGARKRELVVALRRIDGGFDRWVVERTGSVESFAPSLSSDPTGVWLAWRTAVGWYGMRGLESTGRWTPTLVVPAGVAASPEGALRRIRLIPPARSSRRD